MNINRNNYEEYFLLYIDRELNADEQQVLESFVRRHPDLAKELERLTQTVAIPPVVVFENRDSLLREEKKRRLLPVNWMRIAASLIILLAGAGVLLVIIPSKNAPPGQTADQIKKPAKDENQIRKTSSGRIAEKVQNPVPVKDSDHEEKDGSGLIADQVKKPAADQIKNSSLDLRKNQVPYAKANPHSTNQDATQISNDGKSKNNHQLAAVVSPKKKIYQQVKNTKLHIAQNPGPDPEHATEPNPYNTKKPLQLPDLAGETSHLLTINHQPSTIPPSTINHQPSTNPPDETTSILVFDNKSKPVTGFLRKLLARTSGDDEVAGSNQKKISVSIFQFSVNKQ